MSRGGDDEADEQGMGPDSGGGILPQAEFLSRVSVGSVKARHEDAEEEGEARIEERAGDEAPVVFRRLAFLELPCNAAESEMEVVMRKLYKILVGGKTILSPYPGRYAGNTTHRIFGTLDCKSGMRMFRKNRVFFHWWEDAIAAGYRPCEKCKPAKFTRRDCNHCVPGTDDLVVFNVVRRGRRKVAVCDRCGKEFRRGGLPKHKQ